jgi:hypothetical protein
MKSQISTMDYKGEANIWMKKPKLDENRIKIGFKKKISSIMWITIEIFCFIVIFYVASLLH